MITNITLTEDERHAVLAALDGYEPDTASYPTMGWSPEEVDDLNRAYEKIANANHAAG